MRSHGRAGVPGRVSFGPTTLRDAGNRDFSKRSRRRVHLFLSRRKSPATTTDPCPATPAVTLDILNWTSPPQSKQQTILLASSFRSPKPLLSRYHREFYQSTELPVFNFFPYPHRKTHH